MPRPERPLNNDSGPVAQFAADLRRLRESAGRPGYRELARSAHFSASTLAEAAGGRRMPTLPVTLAYVRACGGDPAAWERRWHAVEATLVMDRAAGPGHLAESAGSAGPAGSGRSTGPGRAASDDGQPAPYRGLATYQPEDAGWFFGREQLVTGIVQRLRARRFLAVFGPSGAGKSSLLRAGLVPAVRDGALAAHDGAVAPRNGALADRTAARVLLMTPGPHPLEELAVQLARRTRTPAGAVLDDLRRDPARVCLAIRQALAESPPGVALLLVVDQFEEVFGHCPDEERNCFVSALLAAAEAPQCRTRVVLGVRADFYARCAEHPDLVEAMVDAQVLIGPMTAVQVRDAVTKPAERAGLMVDGALVSTVVAAVAGRAGALPLVSHALLEAWRRRRGSAITLAGFEAAGGLAGAVAQTAEDVYADLDEDQRRRCRAVLLRMIEPDGVADARRVALAELDADDPDTAVVLDRLAAARLLTLDDGTAGLAHEALISAWPRLRAWADEDREGLRIHRQLTQSAAIWRALDHDPGALYRGVRLLDAVRWSGAHPSRLSPAERRFLEASAAASRRETLVRRRRLRLSLAGLVSALVAISALAGLALVHAGRARTERDLAVSRQLIADARSQLQVDPELALVLAGQAYDRNPAEAETILRQATLDSRQVATLSAPHESALYGVAFDPSGGHLAATGEQVRTWDLATGAEQVFDTGPAPLAAPSEVAACRRTKRDVAYGPDGRHLAAIRSDGAVVVWALARPDAPRLVGGPGARACAVAFSPDGRRVAGAGEDGTIRIHALDGTGRPTVLRGHRGPIRAVAFSPDGRQVASAGEDRQVLVQPADGLGRPNLLTTTRETATAVAFHPTGQRVAAGALDGTAHDIGTSRRFGISTIFGLGGQISSVAYSPDGERLAAAQSDGLVQLWGRDGQGTPLVLRGHRAAIAAVAFNSAGKRLASAGLDGTVRLWDTGGRTRPLTLRDAPGRRVWTTAVSPDGRQVADGGGDGSIRIWDTAALGRRRVLLGHRGRVHGLSFSADGRRLASVGDDGTIRIWDMAATAAPPIVLPARVPGDPTTMPMALSPDGRRVVTAGSDGVYLWLVAEGTDPRRLLRIPVGTTSVAFSPDGQRVASASEDGVVRVVDTAGRQLPAIVHRHTGAAYSVAFSPDGGRVASAGQDATVRLSAVDGSGTSAVLASQVGGSRSVVFSPDGRLIATIGQESIRIWNSDGSAEPIVFAGPMPFHSVAFTPDGRRLVTTNHDTAVRIWQCEVCGPIDEVLALAGKRTTRQLTPDERRLFLGNSRS